MTPARLRLLDSDVVIDLQHQHPAASAWYASAPPGTLALPGHALMELYQDARNTQQTLVIDRLTDPFPVVWPTDAEGLVDALIAATALSLGAPLCTFNVKHSRSLKHFRPVPGLVTEQPYLR
jgi:predicted nucleic acid-binding protein